MNIIDFSLFVFVNNELKIDEVEVRVQPILEDYSKAKMITNISYRNNRIIAGGVDGEINIYQRE
ncbi:MAG: hypothetical protein ACI94Y_002088 [Maribacter sp.]|jgi:hypothetical protein